MPQKAPRRILIETYGCTDVGRVREHNEDSWALLQPGSDPLSRFEKPLVTSLPPQGMLFIVADGMGGATSGELASAMAIATVTDVLSQIWKTAPGGSLPPEAFAEALHLATDTANARIHQFALKNPEHHGMGTTSTAAALAGDTLFLSQVGDSRAYLLRNGALHQLTRDQSLIQRLVDSGDLTPEEAEESDRRNIILQALGPEPRIQADISSQRICSGDLLLLCSDGLTTHIRDEEIRRVLSDVPSLKEACDKLVALANEAGGRDNITIILARFSGEGLLPPGEEDKAGYTAWISGNAVESRETGAVSEAAATENPQWQMRGSALQSALLSSENLDGRDDGRDRLFARFIVVATLGAIIMLIAVLLIRHDS